MCLDAFASGIRENLMKGVCLIKSKGSWKEQTYKLLRAETQSIKAKEKGRTKRKLVLTLCHQRLVACFF